MEVKQKRELRKFIENLEQYRGRHTELVSVYVPAGYDLIKIIHHLMEEQGTASNIKDKRTRTNVIDALEKVIRHLRLFKKTPENGLAVFGGNISDKENQIDIQVFSIEPSHPLNIRLYRCDQTFVVDILKDMMVHKGVYGLLVVDRREGTLGYLKGNYIAKIANFTSDVPGKTTKGGQSQARYARLREEAAHNFFKKVGSACNKEFIEMEDLKGIIVGGPGPTKDTFLDGDYLHARIKEKIIGVKDLSYTGEFGLNELVDKSHDVLGKEGIIEEKKIMERFFNSMSTKGGNKGVYKEKDVRKALEMGAVDVLLLSEDLDDKIVEELEKKAEDIGASVVMISIDSAEGQQLGKIGGMGAILRFKI
ncbi:MAG: peptide chain release factor aRF-1 [Candidatus Woesearchaeota archaeon]